jgi:hypothetical protein
LAPRSLQDDDSFQALRRPSPRLRPCRCRSSQRIAARAASLRLATLGDGGCAGRSCECRLAQGRRRRPAAVPDSPRPGC